MKSRSPVECRRPERGWWLATAALLLFGNVNCTLSSDDDDRPDPFPIGGRSVVGPVPGPGEVGVGTGGTGFANGGRNPGEDTAGSSSFVRAGSGGTGLTGSGGAGVGIAGNPFSFAGGPFSFAGNPFDNSF
jgi:hypothetical protein